MVTNDSCIDCGAGATTMRCAPCQRRHNDRLQAEHDLLVQAMFRSADGRPLGRDRRHTRRAADRASATATVTAD